MGLFWGDKSSSHLDETCKLFFGKIAPGTSSSFSFTFSCFFFPFNSTFRFAILSCFNPAETFHYSVRHVCLHSPHPARPPPPPPPNNLINARARASSLDPRLPLDFEVSYCQTGFWVRASVCRGARFSNVPRSCCCETLECLWLYFLISLNFQ